MILIEQENINGNQAERIENLLRTSLFDIRQREEIEREVPYMDYDRAEGIIQYLLNNQQCKFTQSCAYSLMDKNHTSL